MRRIVFVVWVWSACSGTGGVLPDASAPPPDLSWRDGGPVSCVPSCAGKTCGDNGCGGLCGPGCSSSQLCSSGTCVQVTGDPLQVDPTAGAHAIHPEIYGLAFADAKTLKALHVPLNRSGGNGTSSYNWQLDVHNTGNDYFYENIADTGGGTYGMPGYVSSVDQLVKDSQTASADLLLTMPTLGWAPKDRIANHPFTCGFPTEKYPVQQSTDPYDAHCGNGLDGAGKQIVGDPANDAIAAPPSFEAAWLAHLTSTFGKAGAGGVRYYQLDNEMMLWPSTHADVRLQPVSSDDVWKATLDYAPLIRSADSNAFVLGYTTWGVLDLFVSGLDTANNNTNDQMAHGSIPLAQWYLRQLASYERQNGARLVDCLDVHYYPQGGSSTLESPRSLWDSTYYDPTWLDGFLGHQPIQLLPRLGGWIAMEYPGTEICVSEYNFNFQDDQNPAAGLVEADVLGIFGKYGVRLAAYWTTPVDGSGNPYPAYRAFQIYRNYDGAGGHFGDTSIGAATQLANVSLYAASDSPTSPQTLTVIIVNKNASASSTTLGLNHFQAGANATVYQVVNNAAPAKQPDLAVSGGRIPLNLPASSITLLVIPHA